MGGELIADIIERAPHLMDSAVNLILQPMSRQEKLRIYLAKKGFEVKCESYSRDAGKYYVCLLATYTGKCRKISELESHTGTKDAKIINKDCQRGYLEAKIASMTRALSGKESTGRIDENERALLQEISLVASSL